MKSPIQLLREHELRAKKRLGQNFLLDQGICARIADAATRPGAGTTLEIGPGLGSLTAPLLARASKVVAIEKDPELAAVLRAELASEIEAGKLELIEADALEVDWKERVLSGPGPHILAGNLPYLITGRLLETATHLSRSIDRAVFMVQAEVANRLLAEPNGEDHGALSIFVQAQFKVEKLLTAKGGAFHPRPEIDSTVVVLTPHPTPRATEDEVFRELVRRAFAMRRKTLRNAWKGVFDWPAEELAGKAEAAGIVLDRRGETLSIEEFERLAQIRRARSD